MRTVVADNYLYASKAALSVNGDPLLRINVDGGPLLASMVIYDEFGTTIGALSDDSWSMAAPGYDIETGPDHLVIRNGAKVIAELEARHPEYVWLKDADFYTAEGDNIKISPLDGSLQLIDAEGALLATISRNEFFTPGVAVDIVASGSHDISGDGPTITISRTGSENLQVVSSQFRETPQD